MPELCIGQRISVKVTCFRVREYTAPDNYAKREDAETRLATYSLAGNDGRDYFYTGKVDFCAVNETFWLRATIRRFGSYGVKVNRPIKLPEPAQERLL